MAGRARMERRRIRVVDAWVRDNLTDLSSGTPHLLSSPARTRLSLRGPRQSAAHAGRGRQLPYRSVPRHANTRGSASWVESEGRRQNTAPTTPIVSARSAVSQVEGHAALPRCQQNLIPTSGNEESFGSE